MCPPKCPLLHLQPQRISGNRTRKMSGPMSRRPGGEGTILTPGGDSVPFRYAVMERADVHASHLPTQGFAKNPDYAHTNERDYRTNRAFQERVMERAMP